eukprot:2750385-Pleurochrysis_carterae.AAC.2
MPLPSQSSEWGVRGHGCRAFFDNSGGDERRAKSALPAVDARVFTRAYHNVAGSGGEWDKEVLSAVAVSVCGEAVGVGLDLGGVVAGRAAGAFPAHGVTSLEPRLLQPAREDGRHRRPQ